IHAELTGETMHVNGFYGGEAQPPVRAHASNTVTTLEAAEGLGAALAEQLKAGAAHSGAVR
ncbi:MAG: hypothetical protein JO146_03655, partial [Candidatus Eremiobacteraeota bacterium]|nr:hypothetical protein [Candidatus Eremiobacteraeota bacterium]